MIFQTSIPLNIDECKAHVVIDLDTGLIGFTEEKNGIQKEYFYNSAPKEFKMALVAYLVEQSGEDRLLNTLICRKGEAAKVLFDYIDSQSNR